MKLRVPRYRVWAGLGIWGLASAADFYLVATTPWWQARHGGPAGALCAAGFVLAFVWSWRGL